MLPAPTRPHDRAVSDVLGLQFWRVSGVARHLPRTHGFCAIGAGILSKGGGDSDIESMGTIPRQRCGKDISRAEARSAGEESQNLGFGSGVRDLGEIKKSIADIIVSFSARTGTATRSVVRLWVQDATALLAILRLGGVTSSKTKAHGGDEDVALKAP